MLNEVFVLGSNKLVLCENLPSRANIRSSGYKSIDGSIVNTVVLQYRNWTNAIFLLKLVELVRLVIEYGMELSQVGENIARPCPRIPLLGKHIPSEKLWVVQDLLELLIP